MINSFLCNAKINDYNQKNCPLNCICHRERRFNNVYNESNLMRNIRQKKIYNNHRFYSNNEKDDNKKNNLSEINSKINRWEFYKSNSKPKENETKKNYTGRLSFKTKNHNYHNININTANTTSYHSFDKNHKTYTSNTFENKKNNNNIKLIECEIYTPRVNKAKNFVYQKKYKELSKTLNNFKNRDNYGYHEIRDVKKNNLIPKNNKCVNTEKKAMNKNLPNYLSINISNNNSFRRSLNINNNTYNANNNTNTNINTNYINYTKNNTIESNKNINIRKYSHINFNTTQNNFNPPKKIIKEENNYSSYKNFKDNHKEYKINNSNNNDNKNNDKNVNKSSLIRKLYIKNNQEEKSSQNIQDSNIKRSCRINNNNNQINSENDNKNISYSNRFLSGDLKEYLKDGRNKDNKINKNENKIEKKVSISKFQPIKVKKVYSPVKTENSQISTHIKNDSNSSYFTNTTDKKITKQNSKYDINLIFKNIDINSIKKLNSSKKKKKEIKIPNSRRINEKILKINTNDKNSNSFILKSYQSKRLIKDNNNNNKEKLEKQITVINNKNSNNNIKYIKNNEIKDNKNNTDKNKTKQQQPKITIIKISTKKYNNPFNNPLKTQRKDLKEGKNKFKEIIKKKCKSSEKKDKEKSKEKDNDIDINKRLIEEARKQRSRTKTKSKAKKHSEKVKYLDKLKIFKYSETNYNMFYDSSTNYSNNIDYKYKKYALKATRSHSKKKKNINLFNLNVKTFEEDFKINVNNINEKYQNLKPQLSVRITLSKKNNVNVVGILRYFKVNYFCSENLRNKYDIDSEDTSEFYNAKF